MRGWIEYGVSERKCNGTARFQWLGEGTRGACRESDFGPGREIAPGNEKKMEL
jgi:hypothetical protein